MVIKEKLKSSAEGAMYLSGNWRMTKEAVFGQNKRRQRRQKDNFLSQDVKHLVLNYRTFLLEEFVVIS